MVIVPRVCTDERLISSQQSEGVLHTADAHVTSRFLLVHVKGAFATFVRRYQAVESTNCHVQHLAVNISSP